MNRDDCGVHYFSKDSFMTILPVLKSQKSVKVYVVFWYVPNYSQEYQYQHSKKTCVFLDYFEDGGNNLFRKVGTYTLIYMASDYRKPKSPYRQYNG
jgi:hypothetical protein